MASDHNLRIATLKLKLKKMSPKGSSKKVDVVKLNIPEIKAIFQLDLKNKFHALEDIFWGEFLLMRGNTLKSEI